MRIAALDLGSNSIHLVVVEVDESGRQRILAREKASVKLARGLAKTGEISPEAFESGLEVLARMASVIRSLGCDTVIACASEVLHEAANTREFIEAAHSLGIPIQVISGEEKARLIYEAVIRELPLPAEPVMLMDIGGASTVLTWADKNRVIASIPIPWGVQRLADALVPSNPPLPQDLVRLKKLIRKTLKKTRKQLPYDLPPVRTVFGTSGTLMALALGAGCGTEFTTGQLQSYEKKLWRASSQFRVAQLGVDPKRAEVMHLGASWALGLLRWVAAERVQCLPVGLREGLVWEAMKHGGAAVPGLAERRKAAIETFAERLDPDSAHSVHVAHLADQLFMDLGSHFELGDPERELLSYAARLHDIGLSISEKGHHKHGGYLIRNANLPGFWPAEKELLAQVVRFHRGKSPRKAADPDFEALLPWHQQVVEKLSAILRVADALDHGKKQSVQGLRLLSDGEEAQLVLQAEIEIAPELEALQDKGRMLFRLLDKPLKVVVG